MVEKWLETRSRIFATRRFPLIGRGPLELPHRIQKPVPPQSNCIWRNQMCLGILESETQVQTRRRSAVPQQEESITLLDSDTHSTNQQSSLPIDGYYPARAKMRFESNVPLASRIQRTYSRSPSSRATLGRIPNLKSFEISAFQQRGEPLGIVPENRSCPR